MRALKNRHPCITLQLLFPGGVPVGPDHDGLRLVLRWLAGDCPRFPHTLTALASGKALVTGGMDRSGNRMFSLNSAELYVAAVARFARHFGRSPEGLGKEEFRRFQVRLVCERKISGSTLNVYTSALRFLYNVTLGKDWNFDLIPYAKTPKKVAAFLTQDEVLRLFAGIANLKHRAIAMTTYAAGLRASEVARLRPCDIDSRRMLIHVVEGKGAKDRLAPLSPALLVVLRQYYRSYRPNAYLFAGQGGNRDLNSRTIRRIVATAARTVLGKQASPNTLRHSCATHLLGAGVNIRIVQGFLGHRRLSSTDRYSHVRREQITATKSPLDLIAEAG
jgi:integrase/recombinase XerD